MKGSYTFIIALAFFTVLPSCSNAQFLKKVSKALGSSSTGSYTENDAVQAIKEALVQGTDNSVDIVSVIDGYFGNPDIKIPFPPEANNIESTLRSAGLGNQVDKAILSINRAAEDAATAAKPIFVAAITGMTVQDAIGIVRGNEDAATQYLKRSTTAELTAKFKPLVQSSLDRVDATKYWKDVITAYNAIPFVKKMNPDLAAYVTGKAIDGLFTMIAKEELKIRKDPLARTTELLKKVFGN
jgi:hypothetical protein